jgi:hypothetical protein
MLLKKIPKPSLSPFLTLLRHVSVHEHHPNQRLWIERFKQLYLSSFEKDWVSSLLDSLKAYTEFSLSVQELVIFGLRERFSVSLSQQLVLKFVDTLLRIRNSEIFVDVFTGVLGHLDNAATEQAMLEFVALIIPNYVQRWLGCMMSPENRNAEIGQANRVSKDAVFLLRALKKIADLDKRFLIIFTGIEDPIASLIQLIHPSLSDDCLIVSASPVVYLNLIGL